MDFSAVILAGGQSSRMGRDKAWLPVRGQPLLARQLAAVRRLHPAEIFISGRVAADYAPFGCPVLHDRFPGAGPLAGIERGLALARAPMLLVLAVDLPAMTSACLVWLAHRCTPAQGVVPQRRDRLDPLAAWYPKAAWRAVTTLLEQGEREAARLVRLCAQLGLVSIAPVPRRFDRCFTNWNTPADWA